MKFLPSVSLPTEHPYLLNKYTQWYYNIIINAKSRQPLSLYTEIHHIIPDCLFTNRSRKGPIGKHKGNPNNIDNLVSLTIKEHVTCHWLLTKMVIGLDKYKMDHAFSGLIFNNKYQDRALSPLEISRIRESARIKQTTVYWWNNKIEEKLDFEYPGDGWVSGRLHGRKFWNNGNLQKMSVICPGDGWVSGRLPGTSHSLGKPSKLKNCQYWNNGTQNKVATVCPGDGWVIGVLNSKDHIPNRVIAHSGRKFWNNGTIMKRVRKCPGEGWSLGCLPPVKSTCQYCNKIMSHAMIGRWHGDKCKSRPNIS